MNASGISTEDTINDTLFGRPHPCQVDMNYDQTFITRHAMQPLGYVRLLSSMDAEGLGADSVFVVLVIGSIDETGYAQRWLSKPRIFCLSMGTTTIQRVFGRLSE